MENLWSAAIGGIIVSLVNAFLSSLKDNKRDTISRYNVIRIELSKVCGSCAIIKNTSSDKSDLKLNAMNQCEASLSLLKLNLVEEGATIQNNISELAQNLMLKADEYSSRKGQDNAGDYLSAYYSIEKDLISAVGKIVKYSSSRESILRIVNKIFLR